MCRENKNQIDETRATRAARTPLATAKANFGTYEERERAAIQWAEFLSSEEGEAIVAESIAEWWAIVDGDSPRA